MNLTFLIPVKIESEDRVRNLTTVLTYILNKFDAKILVQEHDKVQRFSDLVLPNIPKSDNIEYQIFFCSLKLFSNHKQPI